MSQSATSEPALSSAHLASLPPSQRHRYLSVFASRPPIADLIALCASTDVHPDDLHDLLRGRRDAPWTVRCLRHSSRRVQTAAVVAFGRLWKSKSGSAAVEAVGGGNGLADVLNDLPLGAASRLLKQLGCQYHGAFDPRSLALADLASLLVPGASAPSAHPVARLGSSLSRHLLPALPPSAVRELLPALQSTDALASKLGRLAITQPGLAADVVLESLKPEETIKAPIELLKALVARREPPAEPLSLFEQCAETPGHWGVSFFSELLKRGIDKLEPSTVAILARIALRSAADDGLKDKVAAASVEALEKIAAWRDGISPSHIAPLLFALVQAWREGRGTSAQDRLHTYERHLRAVGRLIPKSHDNSINTDLSDLLFHLPARLRLLVLSVLYDQALTVPLSHSSTPPQYPRFSAPLLAALPPADGEPVLRNLSRTYPSETFRRTSQGTALPGHTAPFDAVQNAARRLRVGGSEMDEVLAATVRVAWAGQDGGEGRKAVALGEVEKYKVLAHRQREADDRHAYTEIVFALVALLRDPVLLRETFEWALERFKKEWQVRPRLFNLAANHASLLAGLPYDLPNSADSGDAVLRRLIQAVSAARIVPDFNACEYSLVGSALRAVLSERIDLCDRYSVSPSTTSTVLEPLREIFLKWEKLRLDDPSALGGPLPAHPMIIEGMSWSYSGRYRDDSGALRVPPPLAGAVLGFLDSLALAREEAYAERRMHAEEEVGAGFAKTPFFEGARSFLPLELELEDEYSVRLAEDAPGLAAYLEKVLFASRSTLLAAGGDAANEDAYEGQWNLAVESYLQFSTSRADRDARVLRLVEHYRGSSDEADLSGYLLVVPAIKEHIWKSTTLVKQVIEPFYPPVDAVSDAGEYDLLSTLPMQLESPLDSGNPAHPLPLLVRRFSPGSTPDQMLRDVLNPPSHGPALASRDLQRRLAHTGGLLAITHLPQPSPPSPRPDLTLDFARLRLPAALLDTLQDVFPGHSVRYNHPARAGLRLLEAGVAAVTVPELCRLSEIVAQAPKGDLEHHKIVALERLSNLMRRTDDPTAMEEEIFKVLADMELSTHHRLFFHAGLLNVVPPPAARSLLARFRTLVQTQLDKQRELRDTPTADASSAKSTVKISTIKYLVRLLADPRSGLSLAESASALEHFLQTSTHPSVRSALLSALRELLVREGPYVPAEQLEPVWAGIERLAGLAACLEEGQMLDERAWAKDRDLPAVGIAHALANDLLGLGPESLPESLRPRWARVVDGMFGAQATATGQWIVAFLARYAATEEETSAIRTGPLLRDLHSALEPALARWDAYMLRDKPSLIRLLEHRTTSFLIPERLQPFLDRLDRSDPDWRQSEQGKTFLRLLAQCAVDAQNAFRTLVEEVRCGRAGGEALQRTLGVLLSHELVRVVPEAPGRRGAPLKCLTEYVEALRPTVGATSCWVERVRPVLAWLEAETTSAMERYAAASGAQRNQGAMYLPLLYFIKLNLLPYPFLFLAATPTAPPFARTLLALTIELLLLPSSYLYLPSFLSRVSAIPFARTDRLPIGRALVDAAKEREEAKRTMGFELAGRVVRPLMGLEEEVRRFVEGWEADGDGAVRMLALELGA